MLILKLTYNKNTQRYSDMFRS